MSDLESFRAETRAWLEENCPPEMRQPMRGDKDVCWGGRRWQFASPAQKLWLERMGQNGWTVPEWPAAYGGGGLTREQAKVLAAEMRALGCRTPLQSFGIWMLGPALLKYGTEEQKLEFLPPIARGEIRWCQGYSEPNAGSDLASLQTKAEDRGDHFLVNGQKVWTSYADEADWIFCLVRTDPSAPKHLGISFILFDMASPGVSTRPITLISGRSPFCETFFDNVQVPKAQLVGELNKGWDVAKYLLTHERDMIGGMGDRAGAKPIGQVAAHFAGTELNKRRNELLMSAGGSDALEWESERSQDGAMARSWLRSKANSIEGGTSEVQLNIIAKRILQLPDA
jgi:alkylation response protein AidB-like acyl-CoA dehydrogenase